uniref:Uncharacterized protein n=1 Tax=Romanomermis culicivorax TaxID=13658 RepID=A0A915HXT1_ROMCU
MFFQAFVEQTIASNMLMISIPIFTSFLQIDAGIVTEIYYCPGRFPCLPSSLKCADADPQSLDIYFLFDRALKDEAILGVEMLKRNLASRSRFGLYVKMIQYNTEGSSQEDCPLGVECQTVGFEEAYRRMAATLPIAILYYRSVGRVAVHLVRNTAAKFTQTIYEQYISKFDLQYLEFELNMSKKRIPEQRIANITKIIKTSAFAKCPNVENEWKVTLSVFQKTQWNNTIKLVCKLHPYSSGNVQYELINQDEEIIGRNDNGTFFFKLTNRYAHFWCRASSNNRRISSPTALADSEQGIPLAR